MTRILIPIMCISICLLIAASGTVAVAQNSDEFVPLQEIEGFIQTGQEQNLSDFFNNAFRIGVGIAGILAVIVLMVGGFEYMTSDIPGKKSDGKDKMRGAIFGIAIILLSAVILAIINPDILQFRFF